MSLVVPTLARMGLRANLRSRRFVVAALVSLVPVLLGITLMVADGSQHESEERFGYANEFQSNYAEPLAYLVLGGTIPFIAMLLAGSIVADDVEDRTFSYILVRPLRRRQIYLSRLVPAIAIAVGLAVLQALAFMALRLLSWSMYGRGTVEEFSRGGQLVSMPTENLIAIQGGMGILAAALVALAFVCLFSFVTVLTTRYHFLANIIYFGAVELLFGTLGGQGAGVVTATYHARSLLMVVGSTHDYFPAPWWLAIPALLALAGLWTWLATRQMGRRDFNVTSAAS